MSGRMTNPIHWKPFRGWVESALTKPNYTVLAARVHGIPALYFHAVGVGGGHAWVSYMKGPGDWMRDIGRYENQNYTTGFAIHSQTNRKMTDHDVEYTCERSSHSEAFDKANAYTAVALLLEKSDPKYASRYAREACRLVKRYLEPWQIEDRILLAQGDDSGLLELFSEKKDAFRKDSNILSVSAQRISSAMRKAGPTKDAEKLMRNVAGAVDDERDDLKRSYEMGRITRLVGMEEIRKARREFEQLLEDQQNEGVKIIPFIREYLRLTKVSGETHAAARFLKDYIGKIFKDHNFSGHIPSTCSNFFDRSTKMTVTEKG